MIVMKKFFLFYNNAMSPFNKSADKFATLLTLQAFF